MHCQFLYLFYFIFSEKPKTLGVLKQILQDIGKESFKTHKTGAVTGKLKIT
jgi:hypothetical protein